MEYDSLSNINKSNVHNLIGQVLVYPESNYIWPDLFWHNPKGKIYKLDKKKSKTYNGKYSKDEYVLGKSFLIIDILEDSKNPLLMCKQISNDDIVYP